MLTLDSFTFLSLTTCGDLSKLVVSILCRVDVETFINSLGDLDQVTLLLQLQSLDETIPEVASIFIIQWPLEKKGSVCWFLLLLPRGHWRGRRPETCERCWEGKTGGCSSLILYTQMMNRKVFDPAGPCCSHHHHQTYNPIWIRLFLTSPLNVRSKVFKTLHFNL